MMRRYPSGAISSGTQGWRSIFLVSADRWCAVLVAFAAVYYLFLLGNGTLQLFAHEMLDKVYGNMLVHLLRGSFTVDRQAIGFEAFTRNGQTYTYLGVFPALLRLPAMPFLDVGEAALARLSCWSALLIFVALQLRMLLFVHRTLPRQNRIPVFLAVMVAATLFSGPQLYMLHAAPLYHESILWASVMAAAFNLVVVRAGFRGTSLGGRELVWLTLMAGLAINTRPSVGIALCLGATLLLTRVGLQRFRYGCLEPRLIGRATLLVRIWEAACTPSLVLPLSVLGLLVAAAGVVNFERWGNPFTFADFHYYDFSRLHRHHDLTVLANYGELSLSRTWIGALYYATGIPYLVKAVPPFSAYLSARFMGIEAPPITPFLTNPLTVLLAGAGIYNLFHKPKLSAEGASTLRIALVGHAAAVIFLWAAMYVALRYRLDFAPFMTLAALIGYRAVSIDYVESSQTWRRRLRLAAISLCLLGVIGSHYVLLVYKVCSIAVPMPVRLALLPYAPFAHAAFEP